MKDNSQLTATDLFCGAGGASEGLRQAGINVVQAVNHDALAIAAHEANHPATAHYVEDITQLDAGRLQHTDILWASLECTNFSNAKGGRPRDADSRSLADHMPRYIRAIQPDYFLVENVREFLAWGPLCGNGKPVSRTKGRDFLRWFAEVEALGYKGQYRLLNSADYGARTSRTRLFICFTRLGAPAFRFPEATHSKAGKTVGTLPWLPVAPCLELDKPGPSIFAARKKPYSENSLRRLLAGLLKFVGATDPSAFLMQNNFSNTAADVHAPARTLTTNGGNQFLVSYYGNGSNTHSISEPAPTVTTKDRHALIQPWLMKYLSNPPSGKPNPGSHSADPCPVITTQDRLALVQPFLVQYNSGADAARCLSTQAPCNAVPTANRFGLVQPFLLGQYTNVHLTGTDAPCPAITTNPKACLVQPAGYIMRTDYGNVGSALNEPAATLVASRRHPYLVQVLPAGQEPECWQHLPMDSDNMRLIRDFCRAHGIADVRMRMLLVSESSRIQGFPEGYTLTGGQTNQKKQLGNAVEVKIATAIGNSLMAAKIGGGVGHEHPPQPLPVEGLPESCQTSGPLLRPC